MIHDQWQQFLSDSKDRPVPDPGSGPAPGLAYLANLAVLRFEGLDARKFLQGYLTCDTTELAAGRLTPTALCNLKGRVVMNGWCAPHGDHDVSLVLHSSLVETVAAFLKPYLMFSKTRLADLCDLTLVLGGLDLTELPGGLVMDERRQLFLTSDFDSARALWEQQPHSSAETWFAQITADGVPLISAPVSAMFLPQMLNLEALGAIDFEKGCYLGQEVVARAQHRGQVKRRLACLTWHGQQGSPAPAPGAAITDDHGRSVGVVLQSGTLDAGKLPRTEDPPSAGDHPATGVLLAVLPRDQAEILPPPRLQQGETLLRCIP